MGCLTASFSNATNSTGAAGDSAVIFSESTTHGTLPWTANYERRCVLYRFTPKNALTTRPSLMRHRPHVNVRNNQIDEYCSLLILTYPPSCSAAVH